MRLPVLPLALALALLAACDRPDPVPAADAAPHAERAAPADTVIYEVYLRSFTPEGTFRAVIPRLDELQRLGVTTLWLMPIHPVGEVERKGTLGSPYSIRDYTAVNPEFGTMEDFRALVDAVHARGMTIILDLVANHTAWDNPWVEEVGIDGYRADVAELVPMDFWREAIAELRRVKPVIMLAEGADPELHAAGFDITYAWNTYHSLKEIWRGAPADTLHTILAAERAAYPPGAGRLRFTTNHDETAWDDTPIALFGGSAGAQAAAVIAIALPGIPLIYNGQEVGDTQRLPLFERLPIDWDRDPAMRRFYERLLAERAGRPALRQGPYEPVPHAASADVLAFRRAAAGDTALVLVNVRDREVAVDLPGRGRVELPAYGWRID